MKSFFIRIAFGLCIFSTGVGRAAPLCAKSYEEFDWRRQTEELVLGFENGLVPVTGVLKEGVLEITSTLQKTLRLAQSQQHGDTAVANKIAYVASGLLTQAVAMIKAESVSQKDLLVWLVHSFPLVDYGFNKNSVSLQNNELSHDRHRISYDVEAFHEILRDLILLPTYRDVSIAEMNQLIAEGIWVIGFAKALTPFDGRKVQRLSEFPTHDLAHLQNFIKVVQTYQPMLSPNFREAFRKYMQFLSREYREIKSNYLLTHSKPEQIWAFEVMWNFITHEVAPPPPIFQQDYFHRHYVDEVLPRLKDGNLGAPPAGVDLPTAEKLLHEALGFLSEWDFQINYFTS